jgi:hypothetical protein
MGPDPAALAGPRHPASFRDPSGSVFRQCDGLIAAECGARVVAFDVDAAAGEKIYLEQRSRGGGSVLPQLFDLMSPSPGLGWANVGRDAWTERGRPDLLLAVALVHHLAIGNNVPLDMIAELVGSLAPALIVEFVPRSNLQVLRLLGSRTEIFPTYDERGFESAFGRHFRIRRTQQLAGSARRLYLMERP